MQGGSLGQRTELDRRPVRVGFVVNKVTMIQASLSLSLSLSVHFFLPLSVPFHQRFIVILTCTLLLTKRHMVEAWGPELALVCKVREHQKIKIISLFCCVQRDKRTYFANFIYIYVA
jgi:hypothetical protein